MMVNVVGDTIAAGASLHVFDAPFRAGLSLLFTFGEQEAYGTVVQVEAEDRVLVEIAGQKWRLVPDRNVDHRFRTFRGKRPEIWIVGNAI
jgi:hypothetical protein